MNHGCLTTGVSEPWQPWAWSITNIHIWRGIFGYPPGNDHISHFGKRNIIFKNTLGGDMLVPRRVPFGFLFLWRPSLQTNSNSSWAPKTTASCQAVLARVRAAVPLLPASHKLIHQIPYLQDCTYPIWFDLMFLHTFLITDIFLIAFVPCQLVKVLKPWSPCFLASLV